MTTITLVACCASKAPEASRAGDLYRSDLFRKMRRYAEATSDKWFILSAKYGILCPEIVIEPYDVTLNTIDRAGRELWQQIVSDQLGTIMQPGDTVTILGGRRYVEGAKDSAERLSGNPVELPLKGLGIGQQLKWLKEHVAQ